MIAELTAEKLRDLRIYHPETGVFVRKIPAHNWAKGTIVAGTLSHGYIRMTVVQKIYAAHRLAWLWMTGKWPSMDIDHIDGNRANNAWGNLRQVDRSTNLENLRAAKSSNRSTGLLGAYRSPTQGRYVSRIQVRGVNKSLGSFGTAQEAHEAYVTAKRELHKGNTL